MNDRACVGDGNSCLSHTGILLLVLVSLAFFPKVSFAQHPSYTDTIWSDLKTGVGDIIPFYSEPAQMSSLAWGGTATIVAGTTGLMAFADKGTRSLMQRNQSKTGGAIASFGNFNGSGTIGGIAAAGLYGTGLFTDNRDVRLMGRHIVQSLGYAGVTTLILKFAFGRERPYMGDGPFKFHGPSTTNDNYALPSGHTTVAFAVSSSLAEDLHNTWASIALYGLAMTTVYARMYYDQHWLSDTFLAAAIGTASGIWTVHQDEVLPRDSGLMIYPSGAGLGLAYKF